MPLQNYGAIMRSASDAVLEPVESIQRNRMAQDALRQRDQGLQQEEAQNAFMRQKYDDGQAQDDQLDQMWDQGLQMIQSGDPKAAQQGADILDRIHPGSGAQIYERHFPKEQTAQANFGNVNPGDFTPPSLAKYAQSKNYGDLQRYVTPAQDKVVVVGGVPTMVDPRSHQQTPLSTLPNEIAGKSAVAGATASGRIAGTTQATAAANLPQAEGNADQAIQVLRQFRENKGTRFLYGAYAMAPIVPGTPQAEAGSILDQLTGKAFLQAYEGLKGGGQITEVEGKKATAAISRLQDRRISYGAAMMAAKDLEGVINAGVSRARKKAGTAAPSAAENDPLGLR